MSRIVLINASPKSKDSASGSILEVLKHFLKQRNIIEYHFKKPQLPAEFHLESQDILVFAFPLYVDGVPSHLVSCLAELEERKSSDNNSIRVYAIANCGFYEAEQNKNALEMIENWCEREQIQWQYGLGIGGGGMLSMLQKELRSKGPLRSILAEVRKLADAMMQEAYKQENHYVRPNFPRQLYKWAAEMGWRQMIHSNGGRRRDLFQKVYMDMDKTEV